MRNIEFNYKDGTLGQLMTSQFGMAKVSDTNSIHSKQRTDEVDEIYRNIDDFEYKLRI